MVRTRIAPSPTGFPHIGTIYQALFNYAFARKHNGQFIVRIEDTDKQRFIEGAEQAIYTSLDWFELTEDESPRKKGNKAPYKQSERIKIYQKYAEDLISKANAYYCDCSKERLDQIRAEMQKNKQIPKYDRHCRSRNLKKENLIEGSYVIRMKIPDDQIIIVNDGIRGEIAFDSNILDDQVIIKSDGFPTYHLAVVVDDHEMEISHVLRGEEWLSSAPKHILLYRYFGWEVPELFHTPLIRNPDKSKLSKRQGHTSVTWYQEEGFLPDSIINYLALMGWTHPEEKELFSMEEFIKLFDFKDLKPLGPVFDLKKLSWMNGQYIMKMENEVLRLMISEFYKNKNLPENIVEKTVPLIKERIKTLKEYWDIAEFYFQPPQDYEKDISDQTELLSKISDDLSKINTWTADNIGDSLMHLADSQEDISRSKFFMTLRVAITGKKITPPLNESMEILGKVESLQRIKNAIGN